MRKIKVGFFEKRQLQEEIAKEIYREMGYTVRLIFAEDYMETSQHFLEISCYRAANKMLERFTKVVQRNRTTLIQV